MLIAFRDKGPDSDLFNTKFVQNLLDYKMEASRWVTGIKGILFLIYLGIIFYTVEKSYVQFFFFLHLLEEVTEFFAAKNGRAFREAALDYIFDPWNMLDVARLTFQLLYWHDWFHVEADSSIFAWMTLFSWLCFLKYL
jgi:hypothetical protein